MANVVEILIEGVNESGKAFAETEASGKSLSSTLSKVGLISGAALAAVGVASIDMAAKYQTSTTKLVTSAGETTKNIDLVRKGMLTMAGQVGMSADDLAKGMYTVESAGYHGAAGLTVLKAAAQGAADEGADLGTVSNAVTDALTDYHLKAGAAAQVTSQLVTAVGFGKTNFQDFSGAMSVVLPLASSLHVKLADVTGVMAEMTSHGISADEAAQQIANTMRHLADPTGAMSKEFSLLGISASQVQTSLGTKGLAATVQMLSDVAKKGAPEVGQTYNAALAKLMGSANGLQVALTTTGENAKGTNAAIAGIAGASTDAQGNVKGFADVQKTLNFQLKQAEAQVTSLAISFGSKLMPAVSSVLGWMSTHQGTVMDLAKAIGIVAGALAVYAVTAKTVAIAQAALNLVMDMNPFVALGIAVVAIAALIIKYHTQIWDFIQKIWHNVSKFVAQIWGDIYKFFMQWWPLILGPSGLLIKYHTNIWNFIQAIWHAILNFLVGLWKNIAGNASKEFNGIVNTISSVFGRVVGVVRSIWTDVYNVIAGIIHAIENVVGGLFGDVSSVVGKITSTISGVSNVVGAVGNFFGFAGGGVVGAASGGPRSNLVMVGEHGRELVNLPAGSRVHSNPDTERMVGGGTDGMHITLELGPTFRQAGLTQQQLEDIRYTVRIKGGGNVQTAFGNTR